MAEPQFEYFAVSKPREYLAHVEINRPKKLNSFIKPMWEEMKVIFDGLSEDPSVRAIIFSGAGDKCFSTGLDLESAAAKGSAFNPIREENEDSARKAYTLRRWALRFQECVSSIERCEKPVICVMHGLTLGLAVDIAVCTDLRICTSDSVFSVKEVDVGIASDIGTLARLPKIVGSYAWVKDVCMTARNFGAEEALRVGFVTDVLPNKAAAIQKALEIGEKLTAKSPIAVQGTKNFLDWCRDHDISSGLQYMAVWNGAAVNTPDVPLSLQALKDRKKLPRYEKL